MGPRGRAPEAHPHARLRRPDLRFPHHGRTRQRPVERRVRRQISSRPRRAQGQMPSHVRHRRARRRSDHPCRRLEDRPYLTEPRAAPQRGKFPSLRSSARGSRDMIESQYRLLKEKFGIDHVVAVIGPSMGGMQTLQWGVSHPDYMDALIAIVPLSKTPPWSVAVMEAARKAIMEDPAWKDGNYDAPPEKGVRLWRDIVNLLAARTPEMYSAQFKNPLEVLPWLTEQENAMMKAFDANDWIYQGWAYERHDVGGTPGFNGDTAKALASIKAKTLILTGTKDLLNPDFEPKEAAKNIADVKIVTISPGTVRGHASAGGFNPADVEFLNRETGAYLDDVTESGKKLQ